MTDDPGQNPPLAPLIELRAAAARRLGFEVENLDPETGYLFEVRNGARRKVFVGGTSPLNDAGAYRLADDKFHTGAVLARAGFRVPATARCLRPGRFLAEDFASHHGREAGRALAAARGFPLVVKPNGLSRGRDIAVVASLEEMASAVERVWANDYLALVQEVVPGIDARLDFLDGELLAGYLRRPVRVEGNGRESFQVLFARLDPRFSGEAFWIQVEADPLWIARARERGWTRSSVPPRGEEVRFDTPILNLNRLCLAEPVTVLPAAWKEHALSVGEKLGLRHFGVDFKSAELETRGLDSDPREATVLEVNASPSVVQLSRMGFYEEALRAEMRVLEAVFG